MAAPAPAPKEYGAPAPSKPGSDVPPYTAEVGPRKGDWEAFLGGTGTSNGEFNDNTIGVTGSVGYYVLKWLPVRLNQSYITTWGSRVNDQHRFSTTGAADFQAPLGRFQPFLGGFVGYSYGDQQSGLGGPEGGIKFTSTKARSFRGSCSTVFCSTKISIGTTAEPLYTIGAGWNF